MDSLTQLNQLNQLVTEFYDKFTAWEHSTVKNSPYSLAQIHTIEALGNDGEMKMKALACRLGVTTGTLTVQIEKLVNLGLIKRRECTTDRRVTFVALSHKGDALYQHHNQLHKALISELTTTFSAEQKATLATCLEQMNQKLSPP